MLALRPPTVRDAEQMWRLVRDTPELDDNSPYAYLLLCQDFAKTTLVAEDDGDIVGFIVGYRRPESPATYFLWQVVVAPSRKGEGLGKRMLDELLRQQVAAGVRQLEATVTPSNAASERLFRGTAERWGAACHTHVLFDQSLFPHQSAREYPQEDEVLFRIGPFTAGAPARRTPARVREGVLA